MSERERERERESEDSDTIFFRPGGKHKNTISECSKNEDNSKHERNLSYCSPSILSRSKFMSVGLFSGPPNSELFPGIPISGQKSKWFT